MALGIVSNEAEFVGRMLRRATAIGGVQRTAVTAAALAYTVAIRAEIAHAAPSSRLRGVGTRGAKVGAGYDVVGGITRPTALISARGPLHLLERDVKPHPVAPRRRKAMHIEAGGADGGFIGGKITAGGSHGKHPFEKGIVVGTPLAEAAFAKTVVEAVAAVR